MNKRNQSDAMDSKDHEWSFKKIMKDIDLFGASHMTWKRRKDLENQKVVSLGGKYNHQKQQTTFKCSTCTNEETEGKRIENASRGELGGRAKRSTEKRRPENRVLKTTEGYFKNGILDVKHMLNPSSSGGSQSGNHMFDRRGKKKMGNGKRN